MNRNGVLGIVIVVVIVAGGLAAAGFVPGLADGDDEAESSAAAGTTTATPAMANTSAEFSFTIDSIQECGQTCRDVTATLHNEGTEPAQNVTVDIAIFADGERLWTSEESVGTVQAGDAYTSTQRVELSYADALAVENNDGWITVETVIRFEDGTEVFTERRQVA